MAALVTSGNITTAQNVLLSLVQVNRTPSLSSKCGDAQVTRDVRRVLDALTLFAPELTTDLGQTLTTTIA